MSSFPEGQHTALLCLGSNLGKRRELLKKAEELIAETCGRITNRSAIYETEAWGSDSERAYLNQVIEIKTAKSPLELLASLLYIERQLGRQRTGDRNADRLMDIDILFFNSMVVDQDELVIPHPRLHQRRFVLVPLNDIAPRFIHPLLNKNMSDLLKECLDPLTVKPFEVRG